MMQLGFVSAILPDLGLDEVFAAASQFDYDCIEVMCWPQGKAERRYAGVTHIDVAESESANKEKVASLVSQHGVEISALGYYPNPLSPDIGEATAAIEQILQVINAADSLGIGRMNTFVGRDWQLSVEANLNKFDEVWPKIVAHAEAKNVRIGIENCPMLFTKDEWPGGKNLASSPAIWSELFRRIPSPNFGLNYDPSHLVWQQMDYLQPIRDFADRLVHVHAKDVRVDAHRLNQVGILAHPLEYHSPKLPGLGDVDWGKFCSVLGDVGYQGPVCVEVEDRIYEGSLDNRKLSLQQSSRFLRNYIPGGK